MSKIDDVSKSIKNAKRAFDKFGPAASAVIANAKFGSPFGNAEKEAYRQQRLINEIACITEIH